LSQASAQKGNKDNNSKDEVVGFFESDTIVFSISSANDPNNDHPEVLKIKYLFHN